MKYLNFLKRTLFRFFRKNYKYNKIYNLGKKKSNIRIIKLDRETSFEEKNVEIEVFKIPPSLN